MWDLPRPGLEPVSPALAGGFSTTAPPGKPLAGFLREKFLNLLPEEVSLAASLLRVKRGRKAEDLDIPCAHFCSVPSPYVSPAFPLLAVPKSVQLYLPVGGNLRALPVMELGRRAEDLNVSQTDLQPNLLFSASSSSTL